MLKLDHFIETLLLPAIALISLAISLADLFGFFTLIPPVRYPVLILLLVSLLLSSLVLIQRKTSLMQQDLQRLLSHSELESIQELLITIDPQLRKVLKDDYFLDAFRSIQQAAKEKTVQVNDIAHFRDYYIYTLQNYPKATFLSVNSTVATDFWQDSVINDALAEFIRGGGKFKIILLMESGEVALPEAQKIMLDLRKKGASLYLTNTGLIPLSMKRNFIVDSKAKIAWEMSADDQGKLLSARLTSNPKLTQNYVKIFEEISESVAQTFSLSSDREGYLSSYTEDNKTLHGL